MSNRDRLLLFSITFFYTSWLLAAERVFLHQRKVDEVYAMLPLLLPKQQAVNGLRVLNVHTDDLHITHVRMQQEYAGVMVRGGYVVLHKPQHKDMHAGYVNGVVYRNLAADLGKTKPQLVAAKQVLLEFKQQFVPTSILDSGVELIVDVDAAQHAVWAYRVNVLLQSADKGLTRPTAIINANTSEVIAQWDDIKTMRTPVKGIGFSGNSSVGKQQYGIDLPFLYIMRDHYLQQCYMENADVKVVDLQHTYNSANEPMEFPCSKISTSDDVYWTGYNSDGYDEINGAFSVANDALYVGGMVKKMYRAYHVEVWQSPHKILPLVVRIHYGKTYENAFWDGTSMTFGDGHTLMYPLVSMGIAAHEISHGLTEQYSNLEYYDQAGGINEAFSDMAAQAAEYYATAHNSWRIGSEILKANSGLHALRYMDHPNQDGHSIEKASQYYHGLDVHYASGVYNRLFYLLSKQWSVTKAFKLMLKANMDYWTPSTNFIEGACGLLLAAKQLKLSIADLNTALAEVAIDTIQCTTIAANTDSVLGD